MAEMPSLDAEGRNYTSCPYCTIQIPADVAECPYCRQPVAASPPVETDDIRRRLVPTDRFSGLRKAWDDRGKWLKILGPVLAALLALWVAIGWVTRVRLIVVPDAAFRIEARTERAEGGAVLLKGTLSNRGEDIPDLSLRSIGVIADVQYRDGRTERKRAFPKSPFRGEGALLRGETGAFEIGIAKGAKSVTLRGEIVDLGEERVFVPSGRELRRVPMRRSR